MATFNTTKILYASPSLIPIIATRIKESFVIDGYEVAMDTLSNGGYDISITKGGLFKAVLGMKTALKVTLQPKDGRIHFEAGVGIWGQQAIPTVISMLFFWPVLITQIWGMVNQAKLDDKALEIAKDTVMQHATTIDNSPANSDKKFCTHCGTQNQATANFCCGCGNPL